jgi:hypothetical protein
MATDRLNDPADFARNQRYAQQLATAIDECRKALAEDPADYVMGSPAVWPILAKLDPNNPDPAVIRQVIAAGEAEQQRLGVPTDQVRPLTRRQAGDIVRGIAEADPATTDLAQLMSQAADRYGPHWNAVFGDLVKAGLPAFYQALTMMDQPGQSIAAKDMRRMLSYVHDKGGIAKLKEAALPEAVRSINDDLDETMAPFRATTRDPVAYANIRDAVQHLAWFYAFQGRQPFDGLRAGYNGILGVRYDFSGALRTPKGEMATVERTAAAVQAGVTPDQLGTVPGTHPGLTNEQRQAIYLDAIGRGFWATNASDDGAVLMLRFRDGMVLPARKGANGPDGGNLISFNFADAARIAAAARPQLPPPEPGAVP